MLESIHSSITRRKIAKAKSDIHFSSYGMNWRWVMMFGWISGRSGRLDILFGCLSSHANFLEFPSFSSGSCWLAVMAKTCMSRFGWAIGSLEIKVLSQSRVRLNVENEK